MMELLPNRGRIAFIFSRYKKICNDCTWKILNKLVVIWFLFESVPLQFFTSPVDKLLLKKKKIVSMLTANMPSLLKEKAIIRWHYITATLRAKRFHKISEKAVPFLHILYHESWLTIHF